MWERKRTGGDADEGGFWWGGENANNRVKSSGRVAALVSSGKQKAFFLTIGFLSEFEAHAACIFCNGNIQLPGVTRPEVEKTRY